MEFGFWHILLCLIGGFIGASVGMRGQLVFVLIIVMIWLFIRVPLVLNRFLYDPLNKQFDLAVSSFGFTVVIVIALALSLFVLLNRISYTIKDLYYMSTFENRMYGLPVGAAIGYFIANYFF